MSVELRRHRSRPHERSPFQIWLRKYAVELLGGLVIATGTFLVVEQNLRATLAGWLAALGRAVVDGERATHLSEAIASITPADIAGLLLIIAALVFLALRIRWRLMHNPELTTIACPRCHGPIHRVHRNWRDHILNRYVPVQRYQCANADCVWNGLRYRSRAH